MPDGGGCPNWKRRAARHRHPRQIAKELCAGSPSAYRAQRVGSRVAPTRLAHRSDSCSVFAKPVRSSWSRHPTSARHGIRPGAGAPPSVDFEGTSEPRVAIGLAGSESPGFEPLLVRHSPIAVVGSQMPTVVVVGKKADGG